MILVGHDIGLMVAYAYAAQHPDEVERIALMDAFLPGVGDTSGIFLLRDKWHFNFYGETPHKLVNGRERIYLEHFWNDFAADRNHSISEADRVFYANEYAKPDGMRATMDYFRAFDHGQRGFRGDGEDEAHDADARAELARNPAADFLINQGRMVDTNVKGVIIKGSGHWLIDEAPEQVMPALVAFIQQPAA